MKKHIIFVGLLTIVMGCKNANTPNYDFGNYTYTTTGVKNELNGLLFVKTMATGLTYEEAKHNAQKKVLNDIMLKGIEKGCSDCLKPPLFLNAQNKESTKSFITNFFSDDKNVSLYTSISRELATWEQKRDMKFTQNQPLGFEVIVKFDELKKLIENNPKDEN